MLKLLDADSFTILSQSLGFRVRTMAPAPEIHGAH